LILRDRHACVNDLTRARQASASTHGLAGLASRYDPAMPNPLAALDADRRSLLPVVLLLAGVVVVLAGLHGAQGLFATVAFGALAAVICRRLQLGLQGRGVGRGWSLTITVVAFVVVIGLLGVAFVASIVALVVELGEESDTLADELRALAESFSAAVGLPPASIPPIEVGQLLSGARSLLAFVTPAVTGLFMAFLIVTYLLLDADRLRGRMLRTTSESIVARYDALATELWTYIKVRAALGAAAAVADTVLLLVLGVPYAVLWGVVSFLFSFVPNIGFVLALVPPTVLAFLEGGLGPALLVVGGYVAINLAFDYVLQPRMMAVELDISAVVVIVSILFWTFVIGPAGALLAVPLTIVLRTLLMPFPQARWFVALLGPVPGEDVPAPDGPPDASLPDATPSDATPPDATPPAAASGPAGADPTIAG
jgi:predicted PurR-regulated permease PerM